MYKHILLLMDCSSVDEVILDHIKQLAKVHGSSVHLFHVVHAHTLDQQRTMVEHAEACLSKASTVLQREGIDASYSYAEGEPAEQVLKKVNSSPYELVALATHGHRTLSDVLLGSISRVLKHESDRPILLIRGDRKGETL